MERIERDTKEMNGSINYAICFLQRKRKLESLRSETEELKKKIEKNEKSLETANIGKEDSVSTFNLQLWESYYFKGRAKARNQR